jgi:hypothetical protein
LDRRNQQERHDQERAGFHFEKIYPNPRRDARISVSANLVILLRGNALRV